MTLDEYLLIRFNRSNHPIFDDEDATTEDIVKGLGHNFDSVIISWGEDFTIEKE